MPRPKDNPATPTVNEVELIVLPFGMSNGRPGKLTVYRAQATYFSIPTTGAESLGFVRVKKNNTNRHKNYSGQ